MSLRPASGAWFRARLSPRLLVAAALALAACSLGGASGPTVAVSPIPPDETPPVAASAARTDDPSVPPSEPASTPRPGSHAAGSPYSGHGYDLSYPQCGQPGAPAGARFAIVGINGGKAFTRNPCLYEQWRATSEARSIYLNSGYNPDNYRYAKSPCRDVAAHLTLASDDQRKAYAIGCAEVAYSYVLMQQDRVSGPQMCWVDVEASNSWDDLDVNLNRFALQGMFDQLAGHGCRVGVYAMYKEWRQLTGDWHTSRVTADWVSLAVPLEACGRQGFSGGPVWLAQELATWPDVPVDSDWAC